jgi:hypothetical protein
VIGPSCTCLLPISGDELSEAVGHSDPPLEGEAVTTRLMDILDRDAAIIRAKWLKLCQLQTEKHGKLGS